jgi:hypothetical protein
MAHEVLLCSGDDALLQHRSVLKAYMPSTPQRIISACSASLPLLNGDYVGAERKGLCGALGGYFRWQRPWSALVMLVVFAVGGYFMSH